MRKKEDIINEIIKKLGAESYLEIGYGTGYNFNKIKCKSKDAVDPKIKNFTHNMYPLDSDTFFKGSDFKWDVVFIDGLHHADQVRKDIINSMKCNAKAIILHDTIPPTEEHQIVPRQQKSWTGDVWRSAIGFHENYPDVEFETYRSDYGLTVIYPKGKKVRKHFENTEIAWEYFKENAKKFLNIID
jgi:hypothetical protein